MKTQTALITGGSSGIGYEMAHEFAELGFDLILVSQNKARLQKAKKILQHEHKVNVRVFQIDLAKPDSAKKLYSKTKRYKIDVLVNNAGAAYYGKFEKMSAEKVAQIINLNDLTLTQTCLLFAKDMKKRKKGKILNVASMAGMQPLPFMSVYAGSKAYIVNFSESLAKELEEYSITVTCLCPGAVKTGFNVKAGAKLSLPAFRGYVTPEEVAKFAVKAVLAGKLTVIPNWNPFLLTILQRFVTRSFRARITKHMMKPR